MAVVDSWTESDLGPALPPTMTSAYTLYLVPVSRPVKLRGSGNTELAVTPTWTGAGLLSLALLAMRKRKKKSLKNSFRRGISAYLKKF